MAHQCTALTARRSRKQTNSRGRGRSAYSVCVGPPLNGRGHYGYFLGIPEKRRTEAHGFRRGRLGAKPKLPRAFGRSLCLVIRMSACALRPAPGGALVLDLGQKSGREVAWGAQKSGNEGLSTPAEFSSRDFFLSTRVFSKGPILRSSFAVGGYTIFELSRRSGAKPLHFFPLGPSFSGAESF